jgi:hypothetical protein
VTTLQPTPRASATQVRDATAHRPAASRTCVGCGAHDDAAEMVHVVLYEGEVVFDSFFSRGGGLQLGGARGKGAHVHPRPACLSKAPEGLARSMRRAVGVTAGQLAEQLVSATERRIDGLLLSARRVGAAAAGADAALAAARRGAPLVIVAVDAGTVADKGEVREAVAAGRAIAWRSKVDLGRLLGEASVAVCAVTHEGIAAELKKMRGCVDAGMAVMAETREDARCRRPEAR